MAITLSAQDRTRLIEAIRHCLTHVADFGRAMLNVAAHIVLGMAAAWFGYLAAEQL